MFLEMVVEDAGFLEVHIVKDVLPENLRAFKDEMYVLADRKGLDLRLDFSAVEQISSRALGVIAVTARKLQETGGRMTVAHLSKNLQRIFSYAQLDRTIQVVETAISGALAA